MAGLPEEALGSRPAWLLGPRSWTRFCGRGSLDDRCLPPPTNGSCVPLTFNWVKPWPLINSAVLLIYSTTGHFRRNEPAQRLMVCLVGEKV